MAQHAAADTRSDVHLIVTATMSIPVSFADCGSLDCWLQAGRM